jgi:alpha-methylacyl-CoA racemase
VTAEARERTFITPRGISATMSQEPFLSGLRVLDLSRLLPGPFATNLLADMGAEIIKVEEPTQGDPVRERPPFADDRSYTALVRNRSKKSVGIDLKTEAGREAFLDLAETADVVFESFRPGVVDRLGVGYDDVRERNEEIVYCSLSGYGQDGPYAQRPGHDINYVGVAGLLGLTGEADGPPILPGYPISDLAGGLYAAFAMVTALAGRGLGRGGEYVDVSMTDAVASFAVTFADRYFGEDAVPRRGETWLTGRHPAYRPFEAADGRYLTVGALEKHFWDNFCEAIGEPDLAEQHVGPNEFLPDAEHQAIVETFTERIAERPRDEWLERFDEFDVPAGPVHEYDEVFEDEQLRERGVFDTLELEDGQEIGQIRTPLSFEGDRLAPASPVSHLGADTVPVFTDVGYDERRVRELSEEGVFTVHEGD